jgi:hypothetical protein
MIARHPGCCSRPGRRRVLCFECYRAGRGRQRTRQLPLLPDRSTERQVLTPVNLAHRARMLEHLQSVAAFRSVLR